jgi:hypothetical protein
MYPGKSSIVFASSIIGGTNASQTSPLSPHDSMLVPSPYTSPSILP